MTKNRGGQIGKKKDQNLKGNGDKMAVWYDEVGWGKVVDKIRDRTTKDNFPTKSFTSMPTQKDNKQSVANLGIELEPV